MAKEMRMNIDGNPAALGLLLLMYITPRNRSPAEFEMRNFLFN